MTQPYLEISYRRGKPYLGYLYLAKRSKVARSRRVGELVIDLNAAGEVLGIELLAFTPETINALRSELDQLGLSHLAQTELQPLVAA